MALGIVALVIAVVSAAGTVYAVVVSRQALAWQKQQDVARVTPSVRIEFEHISQPRDEYLDDPRAPRRVYLVRVSIINVGQTTERLKRWMVTGVADAQGIVVGADTRDDELPPRARLTYTFDPRSLPHCESGFIAIASLAGGEEFTSDVEYPDTDLLAHVEEHHRSAQP